ncbi:hypothetical protein [Novipirellula artificiosorum]|uniref:Secreted protein n=1 Tax=Novipirellula artificiosorum TaxID=2528016 RepID=A0A5C6DX28_9BACT|nr:hypothetical protein [Novipirellula artificiosorum]TWU39369.1 hypothetical protein Poly41_21930 [Novipirellula artificiosorum]
MKRAAKLIALTLALFPFCYSTAGAEPDVPDPSPWSFLEGSWSLEQSDGAKNVMSIELNEAKNCYVASSDKFQGTFGIDQSSDHQLLALGYHPGKGYSVGHFKRLSATVVAGKFLFFDNEGNKTEHTGKWEKTDYGYSYLVDEADLWKWHRQ